MKKLAHLKPILNFIFIGLCITTLSRLILFLVFEDRVDDSPHYWYIFPIGLRFDLILLCYLSFLPAIILSLVPDRFLSYFKVFLYGYFTLLLCILLIMELSTLDFVQQYDTRPNRLFLDYLIYPKEVIGTLFKSYLPSIIITLVVMSVFIYLLYRRRQKLFVPVTNDYKWRLLVFPLVAFLLFVGARSSLTSKRPINASNAVFSFDQLTNSFRLNEQAEPVGVYFKEAKDSNHLIEEFMLLANRKVAEFIGKQNKTFVYRIHDEPDEDKLIALQTVISKFGYKLDFKSKNGISKSLNNLLGEVQGKKEQNLVDTLAIRSMSKAKYSTDNIGHYGLAFEYYSHFTSPIRRYPDVMAHRLLQYYLDGGKSADADTYEEKCAHSSTMEALAANAERDSIKYMQVKYMMDHRDEEFLGVVSGVTEWGIYVEIIENKCEGMCRIREIKDDYYTFDEKQYALVGEVSHNIIQLGDEVMVKLKHADLVKKQLDFQYLGKKQEF